MQKKQTKSKEKNKMVEGVVVKEDNFLPGKPIPIVENLVKNIEAKTEIQPEEEEKDKSRSKMNKILKGLQERYGRHTCLGKDLGKKYIECFSVYPRLDKVMGKGLPKGRIVEIYGKESVGKSSICNIFISKYQKAGEKCALIELDNGFDAESMEVFGVNIEELMLSRAESSEEALDTLDIFIRSKEYGLVVLDCIAMLCPEAEQEGSMQDNQMALIARHMNKVLRKIHSALQPEDITNSETYNNTCVILINQTRTKLGVLYGSPETTSGGSGKNFSASIRLKMSRIEDLKDEEGIVFGLKSKVECIKNKTSDPKRECEISISHRHGDFYEIDELFDLCVEKGLFVKEKRVYKYNDVEYKKKDLLSMLASDKFKKELGLS